MNGESPSNTQASNHTIENGSIVEKSIKNVWKVKTPKICKFVFVSNNLVPDSMKEY